MSAKSGMSIVDLSESSESGSHDLVTQNNIDTVAQNIYTHYSKKRSPEKQQSLDLDQEQEQQVMSPSALRRSLTLNYDCDWNKASTMPHDYNKYDYLANPHF